MKKVLSVALATALASASLASVVGASDSHSVSPAHYCIVSLSPSATETLFAIGAGSNVEAVDTDSNFPVSGLPKTRIDPFNPNAEQIATLCRVNSNHKSPKPDLVVISYDANSIKEKLGALGVPVLLQDAPTNLAGAYGQITALGMRTGHLAGANHIVAALKATIANDVRSVPRHSHKSLTTYYELDPTLYSLTSSTFVGALMKMLGVTNIADSVDQPSDNGYPQLNAEYLITASPRLVFLADTVCCHANATTFGARAGFSTISAVRYKHIKGLNDDVASRWGPRLGLLMNELAASVRATLADPRPWSK